MLSQTDLKLIENKIGYEFKNKELLTTAFTHSSFANTHSAESNERLEYLGDSVLNFASTCYLYKNFAYSEGDMSKIRAYLVSSENVSKWIVKTGLINYLMCENFNPKLSSNVMGDLFESIIGAMLLDSNYETCERFILNNLNYSSELIAEVYEQSQDYKTKLQEFVQKEPNNKLEYQLINTTGPAHNPMFTIAVVLNGKTLAKTLASSKKHAENMGAKMALQKLIK